MFLATSSSWRRLHITIVLGFNYRMPHQRPGTSPQHELMQVSPLYCIIFVMPDGFPNLRFGPRIFFLHPDLNLTMVVTPNAEGTSLRYIFFHDPRLDIPREINVSRYLAPLNISIRGGGWTSMCRGVA